MKKLLLSMMLVCAGSAVAQTTYNYFDPADVDADGWLWFDTQAKIDKYVGYGSQYKIQLQDAQWENAQFQYAESFADPEIPGYNASGEEAGDGAYFGAIVLPDASNSGLGTDNPDGGGIMMWLPDCAQIDLCVSTWNPVIVIGLKAGMGDWVKPVDCALVFTWMKMGSWVKPLASAYQTTLPNIQSYQNKNSPYTTIASSKGNKVTALITNNGKELMIHGMRVLTYTNTNGGGDTPQPSIKGDVNGDGFVTIEDAQLVINSMLGSSLPAGCNADVNGDGSVSIEDAQQVINTMLAN